MASEEAVESQTLQAIKAKLLKGAACSTAIIVAAALLFCLLNIGSDDSPMVPLFLLLVVALVFIAEEYFSYLTERRRAVRAMSNSDESGLAGVKKTGTQ